MINKQEQQSGDNSTNIQAHQCSIHTGLTYVDVKAVALDVFRSNFYELAGKAQEVAYARAEEITLEFLEKLQTENPLGLSRADDPNFQQALFTVQKEYAITGDKELGSLLVDLLVDRSKHQQRSIIQIVLNESLMTAPKLTSDQLAALALIFLFKYTGNYTVVDHHTLGNYFDRYVLPFSDKLNPSASCYRHLDYSGCGSALLGGGLAKLIRNNYQGLFFVGFEATEVAVREISLGIDTRFFIPCLNNPNKLQVNALNKLLLEKSFMEHSIDPTDREKILALFIEGQNSDTEVEEKCISIRPYMENVFSVWNSSDMQSFSLTSVGMAIGHANIKRFIGEFTTLSEWIK